ncbi:hypothetical protein BTT_40410 [Bacillus thuringiensis serovar morrisoni str. 4AA1]|uniref:hypothetical protein n=1 Tax=Bacillus TaxID=1386 RepID=UPI0005CEDA4C|nr:MULTISPECIES: hypothetical protein [Bacillus]AJQ60509.1 hypothetical protein SD98_20140 [Bacillus thuringiensis serovar morrisoni]MED3099057.1 hypothetical protein [Bacillus thuringiensis]MRA94896.1 hypothetical protein [Bacillus thuringiensis]OTY44734.1 hypothetical protein BK736_03860 [Bacillus thuringiensis serovar poloniensis]RNG22121.1 hypothetical protein EEL55_29725 [Bacillus thuringiensis]
MGKKRRYLKREDKKKQNRDVLDKKSENEQFKPMQESVERLNEQFKPIWESVERLNEQFKPIWKSVERLNEQFKPIWKFEERLNEQFKPMQESVERLNEQFKPILEMQKRIQEQYQPLFEQINKYKNINWDILDQAAAEELKQIDSVLIEHEKEYWCLDMKIAASIVKGDLKEGNLSKYVEDNLEAYVVEIIQNPIYEIHTTLIEEAYEAYKIGLYKLCIMPLFAAFEHVIAFWFKGNITKEMVSIKSNPKIWGLHNKIKPEEYRELEVEQIKEIFAASVLNTFKKTFIKGTDELGTNLNRNSIAHGFHDYNTLSKVDALKLFQLLKSALILQFVSPKKVAES